eukprot:s2249_g5.t1
MDCPWCSDSNFSWVKVLAMPLAMRMPPELIGEVDWPVQVKEVIDFGKKGKGWAAAKPWRTEMLVAGQSREVFLMEMLAAMDHHMHQLRETQQGLVATVEEACKTALKGHFGRLVLVGSAALRVETPGSDVDAVGLPVTVLRRVHWSLKELLRQSANYPTYLSTETRGV